MSNEPDAVSSVRRVDGDSWNNDRLYVVSFRFQVSAHLFEYHSVVPSNKATHVLSDDPYRLKFSNDPKHFRPEIAVVLCSLSLSGLGERLARESSGEDERPIIFIVLSTPPCLEFGPRLLWSHDVGVGKSSDVVIYFCVRPVFINNRLTVFVVIAEDMLCAGLHSVDCECKATYTAE